MSVGRAVAKKGYDDLLDALARLPRELNWRFIHVGGGVLSKQLKSRAAALGLGPRIEWRGAQPQARVIETLREGDLFVLAAKVAADGDRDGLPNVLMEAASQRLCALSTKTGAIGELIRDNETGVLVPAGDPARLAQAMAALIRDPEQRERLGRAAEARLKAEFDMQAGIGHLALRFGLESDERRACA